MALTFDAKKSAKNLAERGLSFARVGAFDWQTALIQVDRRYEYGELRLRVLALLGDRLHAAVVTPRGEDLRVISLRKANDREVKFYGESKKS